MFNFINYIKNVTLKIYYNKLKVSSNLLLIPLLVIIKINKWLKLYVKIV